jgi:hypothetical protein
MIERTIHAVSRLPLALSTGREEFVKFLVGEPRPGGRESRTEVALALSTGL